MATVKFDNVDIEFPIYDVHTRSIRRHLLNLRVGAAITTDAQDRVIVNALKNINFTLNDGDRVGLLGHNGSGKSTLLRAMANIYEPVRGKVKTVGRISTMFDLTIGMDPDASGLENIYLQGMIIGMTNAQIDAAMDDITDFTELGNFMLLPIRTYSSGMLMRLAFAIITSSMPEILLIDEVIGAGDRRFFSKAEERLKSMSSHASIVCVASHSERVIKSLCNKAILMKQGELVTFGEVEPVFEAYHKLIAAEPPKK